MEISVSREKGYVLIKLEGSLIEGSSTNELNEIIEKMVEEDEKNIIIDLNNVKYANSTGLSVLFKGYRVIEEAGGNFKVVNLNRKFRKLMSITKFDTLFEIHDDLDSAINNLND